MTIQTAEDISKGFITLLNKLDVSEEELHQYLVRYPGLLPLWYPYQNIIFSKLRFGSQRITDFVFARPDTPGVKWHLIEMERPNHKLFTAAGDPTAQLSHALRQLHDWAAWFEDNRDYIRQHFPFKAEVNKIGLCRPELILIIGRRSEIKDDDRRLMRMLSEYPIRIMTFDRLIDQLSWPAINPQVPIKVCSLMDGKMKTISTAQLKIQYEIETT